MFPQRVRDLHSEVHAEVGLKSPTSHANSQKYEKRVGKKPGLLDYNIASSPYVKKRNILLRTGPAIILGGYEPFTPRLKIFLGWGVLSGKPFSKAGSKTRVRKNASEL